MKQNILLAAFLCLSLTACAVGQVEKSLENKTAVGAETSPRKQILLTNAARFTGNRALEGGSGFLIRYKNSNYAVTAKHLLGEAGGVEPEVRASALEKSLLKWEMSPRVVTNAATEIVELNADGLNYAGSVHDILLLNVAAGKYDLEVLTPNFNLPAVGEQLFLVGCPYSETGCRQNFYAVKYVEYDAAQAAFVCETTANVDFSGFSGAPLINRRGEAVGVLVSGADSGGKTYVMATHIGEIKKIK